MNPLLNYYIYQAKIQWLTILLLLVVPVVIPFVIYTIMISFMNTIDDVKVKPFEAPQLPSLDRVAYADKNLVYFSYSPDQPEFKAFVENIFVLNDIKNARTRAFTSPEEAEHYFNVKNVGRLAKERYENASFYSSIICEDYRAYKSNEDAECSVDLSDSYKDIMRRYYNLSEADLTPDMSLYEDNILFHINFFESAELIQGVPKNITYEIVYNTTILDKTIVDFPDQLSKQFGNNPVQPFWTGYSYTLQENLNKLVLKKHTNIDLQTSNKRFDNLINSGITAEMFFEITIAFSWSVLFILSTLLSINNKGKNQIIIRRLGVKEINFYLANYTFTLIPTLMSCLIMQIVWYSTALLPYSAITFGFGLLIHTVVAFLVTASSTFISCLMDQSHSGTIAVSCLLSFFLLILPSMFHAGMFQGQTLWDPTIVPQWGTWLSMASLPPFSLMGLIDSMTSSLSPHTRNVVLTQYDWKIQEKVTPIKYLFTDYQKYHSMTRFCMNSNSKHGEISPIYNRCIYHQPLYGNVVLLASLQALVFLPLLSLWYSYTVSKKGFRGLPSFFVLTRRFWKKRSTLRPGKPVIAVKNLSVGFETKGKACKKNKDVRSRALGKLKLALTQLDYFQEAGTISALVAESSSGKSTTMSYLAGEVNQLNLKKFVARRAKSLRLKLEDLDSQNVFNRFFEAQDELQVLSALRQVDETSATILENYDLTDPIDAYFVKPFVGHLPQDFSNVWMNLSCFHNVYFSLLLRTSSQRRTISKKEAVQQTMITLKMMELDDPDIQKRTAVRLSGGMLRRLALCNVVVGDPKILLLDEISAGVDPVMKRKIWKCIQDLKNRVDVSVILSTHDTSEIAEMAQRITIMDKGFTLVRNQSPFDLRQNFHMYSVKFYNEVPTCSNQLAQGIVQEISQKMGFESSVIIDSVSPHGIQIKVQQKLNGSQVLKLNQLLSQLTTKHKFQDYILQKAKLDDVYIDTIKYKRLVSSITDQQQDLQQITLTKQNQVMNRIVALFQKSILSEFKHRFPHIVIFSLVCVFISLIIHYFVLLMKLIIDITTKVNIIQNRQNDNAFGCFSGCSTQKSSSPQGIKQCIINRPENLFTFNDNQYSQSNRCGLYMNYLGLDSTQQSYIAIGDYRYNNLKAHNYHFSINEHEVVTQQKSMQSQQLFEKNIIVNQQNSSINFQNYPQFNKYFSNFDPSVNKSEGGVLPYILPKFFLMYIKSDSCLEYSVCTQGCFQLVYKARLCKDQFDLDKCLNSCGSDENCEKQWNIFIRNSTRTFKNDQESLNVYKETMTGKLEFRNESYHNINHLIRFGEDFGLKQNIVNFKFNKYEVNLLNKKLSGTIQLELQHPVPNRGLTGDGYMLNKQCAKFLDYPEFVCDEGIKNNYYSDSECYVLPSMPRPHEQGRSDTVFLQSLPDRDHVTLFDIQNEPFTTLTGALIRKQIFQNSLVNDQKPWQFSYSLVARTMSFMGNPNLIQSKLASEKEMSFMIMQIVAAGMIPMMYSGLKLGGEIESNILRLLQFHFISPTSWIINSLIYYIIITTIIIVINLLGEWIFLPELVSNPINIILYIVESVESIITGMLLAVLTQKARTAIIYSFFHNTFRNIVFVHVIWQYYFHVSSWAIFTRLYDVL
ncbi:ABC_transporter family protein [Hexamita inflata]|uniref:ABC transporter family protein n=1 Tax=Hexamita inflata TaxID=28002 RepID=A0AA86Q5J0_9EUKA|nr:ABC transporter family protein [Hexamita inflata]